MKIYFTASQRGKKEYGHFYKKIYDLLEEKGCIHIDSGIVTQTPVEFYSELEKKGTKGNIDLYEKNTASMKLAEINIFECSFNSLSIGFMVQRSLELNKPTIVLYTNSQKTFFLEGIEDEKLIIASYNEANLKSVLSSALEKATNLRDKRFNFFINPSLLKYLEEASKKENITKSTFIRNLILSHKRKSK